MGDPAGVGPEVCLHLLANPAIADECMPIVFGDAAILQRVAEAANLPLRAPVIPESAWNEEWPRIRVERQARFLWLLFECERHDITQRPGFAMMSPCKALS